MDPLSLGLHNLQNHEPINFYTLYTTQSVVFCYSNTHALKHFSILISVTAVGQSLTGNLKEIRLSFSTVLNRK